MKTSLAFAIMFMFCLAIIKLTGCAVVPLKQPIEDEIRYGQNPMEEELITRTFEHNGQTIEMLVPSYHKNFDFTDYPELPSERYNSLVTIRVWYMSHLGFIFYVTILQTAEGIYKSVALVEETGYFNFYQYDEDGKPYQSSSHAIIMLMDSYSEKEII